MFKVNNKVIVNFEHISDLVLVFLLLTLKCNCRLGKDWVHVSHGLGVRSMETFYICSTNGFVLLFVWYLETI